MEFLTKREAEYKDLKNSQPGQIAQNKNGLQEKVQRVGISLNRMKPDAIHGENGKKAFERSLRLSYL